MTLPLIGITMGDPAGIGPEICAKALTTPEIQMIANCVVIGDRKAIREGLKVAKIQNIEINSIKLDREIRSPNKFLITSIYKCNFPIRLNLFYRFKIILIKRKSSINYSKFFLL